MKRLFTYISVLALAVSCETMYGPVQTPIAADKGDGIEITVTETKDAEVTFTIAPKSESAYYSYLVELADEPSELDSNSLYTCAYKGEDGVVKVGTFKWNAEAPASIVTIKDLQPNTTYQIYAVAGSPMGFLGEVANASFTTSDGVSPVLEDATTTDAVVELTFSEAVLRGEGALTVGYYAMNSDEIAGGQPVGSVTVAEENIAISGNIVTVTIEGLPAGAYYALNYPAGAFKDASNNPVEALTSSVAYGQATGYAPEYDGVGGREVTEDWNFQELEAGLDLAATYLELVPDEYGIGYIYTKKALSITYAESGKSTTWSLAYNKGYGFVQGKLLVILPEALTPGLAVTVSVPAALCEDYYGNYNAAWEGSTTSIYDMTVPFENVVGTFVMTQTSALDGQPYESLMILEQSDDPVSGNVMMTAFESYPCNVSPIYGVYNPTAKTLTFPSQQVFAKITIDEDGSQGYLMFVSGVVNGGSPGVGTSDVVFGLSDEGLIISCNYYYGVVVLNASGQAIKWYDFYYQCASAPYVPEPQPSAFSIKNANFVKSFSLDTPVIR